MFLLNLILKARVFQRHTISESKIRPIILR